MSLCMCALSAHTHVSHHFAFSLNLLDFSGPRAHNSHTIHVKVEGNNRFRLQCLIDFSGVGFCFIAARHLRDISKQKMAARDAKIKQLLCVLTVTLTVQWTVQFRKFRKQRVHPLVRGDG